MEIVLPSGFVKIERVGGFDVGPHLISKPLVMKEKRHKGFPRFRDALVHIADSQPVDTGRLQFR